MIVDSGQLALLRSQIVRIVPILFINTPTPVRVAASFGSFVIGSNGVDTVGGTYLGLGDISGLPSLDSLINGAASRLELTISAIGEQGDEIADAIEADTSDLITSKAHIGFILLDANYQPSGADPVFWLWAGTCDKTAVQKEVGENGAPVKTISISVGSVFVRRRYGRPAYYTDTEQRQRSATDAFCMNVKGYSQETTKPWPN